MGLHEEQSHIHLRDEAAKPPPRGDRWRWYGPGLIWMVSAVGSGQVLFTPRIGSRYGYELLWTVLLVGFFMWVMIREVGRYSVVSGRTLFEGYYSLPGPRGWAIWVIVVPGVVSAVSVVAGISALIGSAMMIALPGGQLLYGLGVMIVSGALVVSGKYHRVEQATTIMAVVLIVVAVGTAAMVFRDLGRAGAGLVPQLPADFDAYFVLPWVGFLLAGPPGVMWYSYWVAARGYGGKTTDAIDTGQTADKQPKDEAQENSEKRARLRSWLFVMSITAAIGVVTGTIINIVFLILGAELLGPQGIIPEGVDVARDLTRLLSEVWGAVGFWLLIVGIVVALWGTVVTNQDGWGRMFADATLLLKSDLAKRDDARSHQKNPRQSGLRQWFSSRAGAINTYVVVLLTVVPAAVFIAFRDPVDILSVGGIVAAVQMPLVIFLTLYVNRKRLPEGLRPGPVWVTLIAAAGLFYVGYSLFYFYSLLWPQ